MIPRGRKEGCSKNFFDSEKRIGQTDDSSLYLYARKNAVTGQETITNGARLPEYLDRDRERDKECNNRHRI
jgi:hypothetical protein